MCVWLCAQTCDKEERVPECLRLDFYTRGGMSWFKDAKRRLTHKFLEFVGVADSSRQDVMAKSRMK